MKKAVLALALLLLMPAICMSAEIPDLNESGLQAILEKNKDKVVMINFFATWCPPCRAEIPEIAELRKAYPEQKLLILGLSVDKSAEDVIPFAEKTGINYPVYMAMPDITDKFNITSVPHNAFFAPGGEMVISEPGIANFDTLKNTIANLSK